MFNIRSAQLLFEEAKKFNLDPQWLTDYGLFSLRIDGIIEYVFYNKSFLNRHIHSYLAKNKHSTRTILEENGFLNIPFLLPKSIDDGILFLKKYEKIIVKPVLGQHSDGVYLVTSGEELLKLDISQSMLEKFIPGTEYRYLLLNSTVIAVHRKKYDSPVDDLELVKFRRISIEPKDWNREQVMTAIQISNLMKLKVCAIDFMVEENEKAYVLEVNSSPGIYGFHNPSEGPAINFAHMLIQELIKEVKREYK